MAGVSEEGLPLAVHGNTLGDRRRRRLGRARRKTERHEYRDRI